MRQYAVGLFLFFISFSLFATDLQLTKTSTFVNPSDITLELLPPPSADGSPEQKRDIDILMWEIASRTIYDEQRAWGSVTLTPSYFNEAINARFEESRYPKLYQLMKTVADDAYIYINAFKTHYKSPRPYQDDPSIKPILPIEESYAYPSGHATRGMTMALVFAEIFPQKREQLIKVGYGLGQDRVIGGVHYPSDIEASVVLAQALAKSIIKSDAFKTQIKVAQQEIDHIASMQKN
ncbi:MAG: phosphatase PAP2 family protein [Taibaiella sp.]